MLIPGAAAQGLVVLVFRGFGCRAEKSPALLPVSVQPPAARKAAVVLLKVVVGPLPLKQFVPLPNPTKSTMGPPVGQAPESRVPLFTSATFPAVALMLMLPLASGVGRFVFPPWPAASWTR